jgi:hypothetical protein
MSATTIDIGFGPVSINKLDGYWGELLLSFPNKGSDRYSSLVSLSLPGRDEDPDDGATFSVNRRTFTDSDETDEAATVIAAISTARTIIALWRESNKAKLAEIEAERKREEEERERLQKEREAKREAHKLETEERRERLMTEFIGERVKIRESGYKGMRSGDVDAKTKRAWSEETLRWEEIDGEFELTIRWVGEPYTQNVFNWRRLDVKVGARWKTVWDDGVDDLSYYDQQTPVSSAKEAPMYDGSLA